MKVLIAGVGRLGAQIAHVLAAQANEVTLIDKDEQRLAAIGDGWSAPAIIGDACEPSILEQAGAHAIDMLVAATGDDEDNLVISLLAKRQFGVSRIVARVNDPENMWLFDARWGVDVALPADLPLVSLIEEAMGLVDTVGLIRLSRAGVDVIETTIGSSSRTVGQHLGDVVLPLGSVVAAVVRGGEPTVPGASFQFESGDELLIVTANASEQDVRAAFQ